MRSFTSFGFRWSTIFSQGPTIHAVPHLLIVVVVVAAAAAVVVVVITDLYSAFRSEDTEALDAAQED